MAGDGLEDLQLGLPQGKILLAGTTLELKPGEDTLVTGPSGAGKGTLIKALVERIPVLEVAISATTRPVRPGEADGVERTHANQNAEKARAPGDHAPMSSAKV